MVHIVSRGFNQEIMGKKHYNDTLSRCYHGSDAERLDDRSVTVPVLLKLENDNPYDDKAVAVESTWGVIGHLSREDARAYRELYGEDEEHTTIAKIYTRTGELYSAWLSLTITEHTAQRVLKRNTPNHEAFAPKPKKRKLEKKEPREKEPKIPKTKKKGFWATLFGGRW